VSAVKKRIEGVPPEIILAAKVLFWMVVVGCLMYIFSPHRAVEPFTF